MGERGNPRSYSTFRLHQIAFRQCLYRFWHAQEPPGVRCRDQTGFFADHKDPWSTFGRVASDRAMTVLRADTSIRARRAPFLTSCSLTGTDPLHTTVLVRSHQNILPGFRFPRQHQNILNGCGFYFNHIHFNSFNGIPGYFPVPPDSPNRDIPPSKSEVTSTVKPTPAIAVNIA